MGAIGVHFLSSAQWRVASNSRSASFCSLVHTVCDHAVVEFDDFPAAGGYTEKRQKGVSEACKGSDKHRGGKVQGGA